MSNPPVQYSVPPSVPATNTTALVSLISGIAGWTILPLLGAIVAVITGHIAKNEIRRSAGMASGDGLATAGLILGYVNIAAGLCVLCLFLIFPLLFGASFFGSLLQAIGSGS